MGKAALKSAGLNDAQIACIVPLLYSDDPDAQCKDGEIVKKPAEDTSKETSIGKELLEDPSVAKFVKSKNMGMPQPAVTGQVCSHLTMTGDTLHFEKAPSGV